MLTLLQCPSCGGLLRSLDARVWQCAYCESQYMLLGEETPMPGLTRVVDGNKVSLYLYDGCWPEVTEEVAAARHRKYLDGPPMPHVRTNRDIRSFWRARKGRVQFGAEA